MASESLEARSNEVEITDDMIDAGADAWALFEEGDRLDWMLAAIYGAMARAKDGLAVQPKYFPRTHALPRVIDAFLSLHKLPAPSNER
jgi:hypothetical protein